MTWSVNLDLVSSYFIGRSLEFSFASLRLERCKTLFKVLVSTKLLLNKMLLSLQKKIKLSYRWHILVKLLILDYQYRYQLLISKLRSQPIMNCFFCNVFLFNDAARYSMNKLEHIKRYWFKWTNNFKYISKEFYDLWLISK